MRESAHRLHLSVIFSKFQGKRAVTRIRSELIGTLTFDVEATGPATVTDGLGYTTTHARFRLNIEEEADIFAFFLHPQKKSVMFDKDQILVGVGNLIAEAFQKGLEDTKRPEGDGVEFCHES